MLMRFRFGAAALTLLLMTVSASAAPPSVGELSDRLQRGRVVRQSDFAQRYPVLPHAL